MRNLTARGPYHSLLFYPPKGTEGGPIVFTYVLFCIRKCLEDFQFTDGNSPKKISENVLFDGTDGRDGRTDGR